MADTSRRWRPIRAACRWPEACGAVDTLASVQMPQTSHGDCSDCSTLWQTCDTEVDMPISMSVVWIDRARSMRRYR